MGFFWAVTTQGLQLRRDEPRQSAEVATLLTTWIYFFIKQKYKVPSNYEILFAFP
jgi:hypothetical protein